LAIIRVTGIGGLPCGRSSPIKIIQFQERPR
jgi:hypothetical protein